MPDSLQETLYLPQDREMMKQINVETEGSDPLSLYSMVKKLISLRKEHYALQNASDFHLISCDYPLVYERKCDEEEILVVVNPTGEKKQIEMNGNYEVLWSIHSSDDIHTVNEQNTSILLKR